MRNIIRTASKLLGRPIGKTVLSLVLVIVVVGIVFFHQTSSKYSPKRGWIEFTGTGTENRYYLVTNEPCTPGDPFGNIGPHASLGPGDEVANVLPKGTQLYKIKGVDPQKAFCVALNYGNGGYVKAVYVGDKAPH